MSIPVPQSSFTVGEITHRLGGRIDLDHYGISVSKARNFAILPQGPLRKRSGSAFIKETKFQPGSGKETVAWIDFIFSSVQSYAICAGDKYFRFFTLGGQILVGAVPYEVVTPYLASEVKDLKYVQLNDVMYIVHKKYPVYKLTRKGETNWTMVALTYIDGPYFDNNRSDTYLSWATVFKPTGTGIPTASWDNADSTIGVIAGSAGAFSYTFSGTAEYAVDGYAISYPGYRDGGSFTNSQSREPRSWEFQGQKYGSAVWQTLDKRTTEADWIPGEVRHYDFPNISGNAFHAYRLNVDANNGDGAQTDIAEISLKMQRMLDTFTFSSATGINGNAGFTSADIGRYIRFQGGDSFWRYIIITGIVNNRTVTGYFYGLWFFNLSNTTTWRLGAFSGASGYPSAISLFEERLVIAGSASQPRTVWFTRTNDFENFQPSDPLVDSGPITVTLGGERLDSILWMSPGKGLFVGTIGGVTSISGVGNAITYKNIQQVVQTNLGASSARPIKVGPALLFQGTFLNCIRELLYNFNDDAYDAPDITFLNEHLYKLIAPSTWLDNPDELMLTPAGDGTMAVLAYVRSQKVYGSTAYETDGQYKAVCSIPNGVNHRSDVYAVVQRTINGVLKQYIEYMKEPFEYQDMLGAWFVDCGLQYTGTPASVFSGLGHLEGKTVWIVGFVGLETSPKIYTGVVTGGSVTAPRTLNNVVIGLPYRSYITLLRARSPRTDGATSFRTRQKIDDVTVDMYRTAGVTLSGPSSADQQQIVPRDSSGPTDQAPELYTGDTNTMLESSWKDKGVITLSSDQPLPAMIRMIMPTMDKEP